jgi:hypothetical protein
VSFVSQVVEYSVAPEPKAEAEPAAKRARVDGKSKEARV